ncbi:O-antigen ligase family protein [Candidatus Gracilibacteria bacterium]|nr:O-antigen ligase family protein [Candidatus Gracilibacteria bacterium]
MLRKIFVSVYFSLLFVAFIYNPWGGINTYELPKQSWLFLVTGLLLGLAAIIVFEKNKYSLFINKYISIIFGLWCTSFIFSTLFSIAPIESFWGSYERLQGLITHAVYGIFFITSLQLLQNKNLQERFLLITTVIGGIISIVAIVQWFFAQPWSGIGTLFYGERSYAMVGSPNFLGQFLLFPIFSSLFFVQKLWHKKNIYFILAVANSLVTIFALVLTRNRASLIALGIAGMFWTLYLLRKNWQRAVLIIGAILGAIIILLSTQFDLRSVGTRQVLWESALPLIADHPVLGSGPETYYQTAQKTLSADIYIYEPMSDIPDRTHNALLDTLLTRGILGLALWVVVLIYLVFLYFTKRLSNPLSQSTFFGLVAYIISIQFGFSLATHIIFFLGFLSILLINTLTFSVMQYSFSRSTTVLLGISFIVCAILAITHSNRLIQTDRIFSNGIRDYIENPTAALQTFNTSLTISPHYSYLYRSLAVLYEKTLPSDYVEELGKISNKSFQYYLARGEFDMAVEKAPNSAIVWSERGDAAFEKGNCGESIFAYEKLFSMAPANWKSIKKNQGFFTALDNLNMCLARSDINA